MGSVGGALLGSFVEDKIKKHHKKKEDVVVATSTTSYGKQISRPNSSQGHYCQHGHGQCNCQNGQGYYQQGPPQSNGFHFSQGVSGGFGGKH